VWLDRVATVDQGKRIATLQAAIAAAAADYPTAGGFGASVGVIGTDGGADPEELIGAADAAMYAAKRSKREKVVRDKGAV